MKRSMFAAVIAAVSIVLVSAPTLLAGVVMEETSIAKGPDGDTASQKKITYVQGNKQKIEKRNIDEIVDLDKSVIYIVDKHEKAYAEVPLRTISASEPGDSQGGTIQLNKTGKKRVVANHPCNEYQASRGNRLERVTVSACVSTSAPGAKQLSAFEHKMASRLNGNEGERSAGNESGAMMLEKQSVVSFRIPDRARGKVYRAASLLLKTRVNDIQLKPLPADAFKPPKGFSKLRIPPAGIPPHSPNVPNEGIQVIAPNLPRDSGGYA